MAIEDRHNTQIGKVLHRQGFKVFTDMSHTIRHDLIYVQDIPIAFTVNYPDGTEGLRLDYPVRSIGYSDERGKFLREFKLCSEFHKYCDRHNIPVETKDNFEGSRDLLISILDNGSREERDVAARLLFGV